MLSCECPITLQSCGLESNRWINSKSSFSICMGLLVSLGSHLYILPLKKMIANAWWFLRLKFFFIKLHLMKFLLMKTSFGRWRHLKARFWWGEQRELPGLRLLPGDWGKNLLAQEMALTCFSLGFPCGSAGKESASSARDLGSIPGLGRSPGEGKGYSLQYFGLENSSMGWKGSDMAERLSRSNSQYIILKTTVMSTQNFSF